MLSVDERNQFVMENYYLEYVDDIHILDYIENTINLAFSENCFIGVFEGYLNFVLHYTTLNKKKECKNYLDKARQLLDTYELGDTYLLSYYRVHAIYSAETKLDLIEALRYTKLAIDIADALGEKLILVKLNSNFGILNMNLGNYEIARKAIEASTNYFEKNLDESRLTFDYYNLGTVYSFLNEEKLAYEYHKKALALAKKHHVKQVLFNSAVGIANYYNSQGQTKKAFEILDTVIDKENRSELNLHELYGIICLIKTYVYDMQYNKASETIEEYESLLPQGHNDKGVLEFYELKEQVSLLNDDFETAYKASKKQLSISSEINNIMNDQSLMTEIKTEYHRHLDRLEAMAYIGKDLTLLDDMYQVVSEVEKHFSKLMPIFTICVGRLKEEAISFDYVLTNKEKAVLGDSYLFDSDSLAARCIKTKKTIVINDINDDYRIYSDKKFNQEDPNNDGQIIESVMYAPLIVKDNILGFFSIQSNKKFAYSTEDVEIFKIIASYIAIALENLNQAEKLKILSETDGLTKLLNRRGFTDRIENNQIENKSTALAIIDLDYFKLVNDEYGHHAGDYVLQEISKLLLFKTPPGTISGRLGGEEFALYFSDLTENQVMEIAENVRQAVHDTNFKYLEKNIRITLSMGIVFCSKGAKQPFDYCYKRADAALYKAKEAGRNKVFIVSN